MGCRARLVLVCSAISLCALLVGVGGALASEHPQPQAESVIVVDAESGQILFDDGAGRLVDPAGLTRLFTAFYTLETTPLSEQITISPADIVPNSPGTFRAGEQASLETLVNAMLLANGDDAAMAAARTLGSEPGLTHRQSVEQFISRANGRFEAMGLGATQLASPYGDKAPGHFSSARDVAALVVYALRHEPGLVERLGAGSYSASGHSFTTQNVAALSYPGIRAGIDAGAATLQIAERDGRTLIAVVLGAAEGTQASGLAMQLLDYSFALPAGSSNGRIAFPDEAPLGQPSAATNLAVTPVGEGSAQVHGSDLVAGTAWHTVKWPLAAALTMIVLLACCVQYRALQRLRQRPPARRRKPARRRAPRATPRPEPAHAYLDGPRDRPVYLPGPGYSTSIGD